MPGALTRPRRLALVILVVLAAVTAIILALAVRGQDAPAQPAALQPRTIEAGEVTVTMTPIRIDRSGARFRLALDTHSVELAMDLASVARLRIGGTDAGTPAWDGSGPGSHHREGTLSFTTPVPPGATIQLRIGGLASEAVGTWTTP